MGLFSQIREGFAPDYGKLIRLPWRCYHHLSARFSLSAESGGLSTAALTVSGASAFNRSHETGVSMNQKAVLAAKLAVACILCAAVIAGIVYLVEKLS